ncbi:zinc ribbon domain-containing protein [Halosimplex sp. TS25]|uniref:zinc ribbon domain-containing protein n=1 Tax=Halosimplex rarum TaxID=3396619 RepID=UPI0039ECCF8B
MTEPADERDDGEGAGNAPDDASDVSDGAGSAGEQPPAFPCPECGKTLPDGARFCPHCQTPIGDDEGAVDLSELDGLFDEGERPEFLTAEGGERRASGRVMVVAGLAVAVPLAPLGLFLVSTVRPLSVWTAPLVFLGSWLAPAAYLARARVPAEAFARSLYLIAAGTALVPLGLRFGGEGAASDDLQIALGTVTAVALLVAGLAAVLGRYMHGQADGRVSGELRAFEAARESERGTKGDRSGEAADGKSNAGGIEE